MGLTSTGIGSGLDIEKLVTQLMTAEKKPITSLQTKEASYQSKVTAYGSLTSALSTFQSSVKALASASLFQGTKAGVADSTIASATANASATTGTYSLEVSKLAQAQKLVAAGQASNSTSIGNGTITFDFGTISGGSLSSTTSKYTGASFASSGVGAKTVTIDSSNNTLVGIRDAVNKAGIGVTATIVNDGSGTPYRLTFSADNSGADNSMKISVSGDSALSSLLSNDPAGTQNLTETATAQNAELKVNGIAVSKNSNTVSDVITGVTLSLSKVTTTATSITVSRDTASVTTAINSFVSAYNTITNTLKSAMAYNAETKTAAILNGDPSVRTIQTQLRGILSQPVSGGATVYSMLSQVGVSVQKDGTLTADSTKLQKALSTNFSDFAGLFANAGKTTDSLVTYSSASSKTQPGSYALNITQMASKGSIVGSAAAGTTITSANNSLTVELNGKTETITLAEGSYTAESLATEIQSKINGNATFSTAATTVKVTQSSGVLSITSEQYGSGSSVSITGGNGRDDLGLGTSATTTGGKDVEGTINGVAAVGSGQTLVGAAGDASEGIILTVSGGTVGARGTVSYSQGYAQKFNDLLENLLSDKGPLTARTKGLNSTIKRLQADEQRVSDRLVNTEKRYRAQFTALDKMMSTMSTTSTYLSQQITALQNLNKQASS